MYFKQSTIILTAAIAILLTVFAFCILVLNPQTSKDYFTETNLYPASMIVTHVNYEEDTVTIEDFNGQCWVFYGAEDWIVNDICACIMNDMGTDVIYDDEIVETRYCGWVE